MCSNKDCEGWLSYDNNQTPSESNFYFEKNLENAFSKKDVDCLQIRTKEKHAGVKD